MKLSIAYLIVFAIALMGVGYVLKSGTDKTSKATKPFTTIQSQIEARKAILDGI